MEVSADENKRRAAVILPLVITLAIQVLVAMAAVTVPVFAPVAAVDIGVSLTRLGIFMAIFYLGGMASSLASGDFVLRYGPIWASQICLIACGAGLAATASGSVSLMIPGALLIGLGYGAVTPASSHILARTAPPHLTSLTFSIKQTGVPAGGAMAGALIPPWSCSPDGGELPSSWVVPASSSPSCPNCRGPISMLTGRAAVP